MRGWFSSMKATRSPGRRPSARNRCATWFECSSSSRYVTTAPLRPMMTAGFSGVRCAWMDGCMGLGSSKGFAGLGWVIPHSVNDPPVPPSSEATKRGAGNLMRRRMNRPCAARLRTFVRCDDAPRGGVTGSCWRRLPHSRPPPFPKEPRWISSSAKNNRCCATRSRATCPTTTALKRAAPRCSQPQAGAPIAGVPLRATSASWARAFPRRSAGWAAALPSTWS
ncbi:hypothetical protein D9M70_431220 [compost metagenome]